jgi:fructose-1,6-bisphosphatase I
MTKEGLGTTITQHILNQQRENPQATGAFTTLMNELIVAAKVISREVNKAGLVDILGPTGKINIQDEQVQKLDVFANRTIIERMQHIGQLWCMGSEEDPDLIDIPQQFPKGDYILVFDPLDGSSNIDVNVSIGTIFGIYKRKNTGAGSELLLDNVLQPGINQQVILFTVRAPLWCTQPETTRAFTALPSFQTWVNFSFPMKISEFLTKGKFTA